MGLFKTQAFDPMPPWTNEFEELAVYNSEVGRGIVHTPEWDAKMKRVQDEYEATLVNWAKSARVHVFK